MKRFTMPDASNLSSQNRKCSRFRKLFNATTFLILVEFVFAASSNSLSSTVKNLETTTSAAPAPFQLILNNSSITAYRDAYQDVVNEISRWGSCTLLDVEMESVLNKTIDFINNQLSMSDREIQNNWGYSSKGAWKCTLQHLRESATYMEAEKLKACKEEPEVKHPDISFSISELTKFKDLSQQIAQKYTLLKRCTADMHPLTYFLIHEKAYQYDSYAKSSDATLQQMLEQYSKEDQEYLYYGIDKLLSWADYNLKYRCKEHTITEDITSKIESVGSGVLDFLTRFYRVYTKNSMY